MPKNSVETHGPVHLGKATLYADKYDAALLDPIPRALARASLAAGSAQALPFRGMDVWTAYEISWLDAAGKPIVAMAEFEFPFDSAAIVESKSFKLYLNSFNQTVFAHWAEVQAVLVRDLSGLTGADVVVRLMTLEEGLSLTVAAFEGENIDALAVSCTAYEPDANLLQLAPRRVEVSEHLCSDLLKSNCPVTGQPDWASLSIRYTGAAIDRASLLRYIVSYRHHRDFHEHCVESIFIDILQRCQPRSLTVYARYTRRGGLDINPFRTNCAERPPRLRLVRQ
ncbi:NADPH-dependent 7-cyano-7-deazaguanine reductase QueF [Simiduia litorea]|uniref:NADPH-dependent 7-cyano-7-deazaguanine reductase QueF n=1 Tax=Simiduia litorea TaxID=1435348 RepID=UPI0036F1B50A